MHHSNSAREQFGPYRAECFQPLVLRQHTGFFCLLYRRGPWEEGRRGLLVCSLYRRDPLKTPLLVRTCKDCLLRRIRYSILTQSFNRFNL